MSNSTVDALVAQVESTKTVIGSATTLIGGIADRIQAAVDAAIAGGASAEDLAPDSLAAAVQANTK